MTINKAENVDLEKLVKDTNPFSLDVTLVKKPSTKKHSRIRRIADPHIRGHKVKGRVYYYYVRGTDKEFYLGDADFILQAVLEIKHGRSVETSRR